MANKARILLNSTNLTIITVVENTDDTITSANMVGESQTERSFLVVDVVSIHPILSSLGYNMQPLDDYITEKEITLPL